MRQLIDCFGSSPDGHRASIVCVRLFPQHRQHCLRRLRCSTEIGGRAFLSATASWPPNFVTQTFWDRSESGGVYIRSGARYISASQMLTQYLVDRSIRAGLFPWCDGEHTAFLVLSGPTGSRLD